MVVGVKVTQAGFRPGLSTLLRLGRVMAAFRHSCTHTHHKITCFLMGNPQHVTPKLVGQSWDHRTGDPWGSEGWSHLLDLTLVFFGLSGLAFSPASPSRACCAFSWKASMWLGSSFLRACARACHGFLRFRGFYFQVFGGFFVGFWVLRGGGF